jgi:hypothetical protein
VELLALELQPIDMLRSDAPTNPCHDLLRALLEKGVWLEQEQFTEECLEELVK